MNSSTVEVAITAYNAAPNNHTFFEEEEPSENLHHPILLILKSLILILIILVAILSNLLVIISVCLYRRLRHINNYFLVSLAFADLMVAFFAMTFNASVEITGQWNFGATMCKLWLSMDVHVSTVSTLHLCCISVDRFYAIVKPFQYHSSITVGVAAAMVGVAWLAPTLISFIPIFLDWYTTQEHLENKRDDRCEMVVNKPYALISSFMTFWCPVIIMVSLYQKVYKEAMTQKRAIQRFSVASNSIVNTDIRYSSERLSQIDLPHNRHLDLPPNRHLDLPPNRLDQNRSGSLGNVPNSANFQGGLGNGPHGANLQGSLGNGPHSTNFQGSLGRGHHGANFPCLHRQLSGGHNERQLSGGHNERQLSGGHNERQLSGGHNERQLSGGHNDRQISGGHNERQLSGGHNDRQLSGEHNERQLSGGLIDYKRSNQRKVSYSEQEPRIPEERMNSVGGSATAINGTFENGHAKKTPYSLSTSGRPRGPLNDVRRATKARMSLALSGTSLVEGFRERHRLHIAWRKEHKAFVTLGIVMGAFLACWLPFFTWYLTVTLCETCEASHTVEAILFWIGYLNSTLNPFIYVMTNHDFKVAFTGVLGRIFCCKKILDARRNSDQFL